MVQYTQNEAVKIMGDKKTDSSKIKKKRMVIEEIDSENEEKEKLEEKVEVVASTGAEN